MAICLTLVCAPGWLWERIQQEFALIRTVCIVLAFSLLPSGALSAAEPSARDHWAFRPIKVITPPKVAGTTRVRTPVDAFVLARLEAKGLTFAPDAERRTLARRLHLDLLGLPPDPTDVDAFVKDERPDAYERLVEKLLASPHFGERWGRHWLDGAGYVDVTGGDNDAATIKLAPDKWRYRDYVIRAFNADKPFDHFLTEQIAGDELFDWRSAPILTPDMKDLLIATGFLRTAADDTDEKELNTLDIRHGVLQRTTEVLANNLLGLTLNCAKCHDHKYEPIAQEDYYRLIALLQPAFNPDAWVQPKERRPADISPVEKATIDKQNAAIDSQVADLRKQLADLRRPYEERLAKARLLALPDLIRDETSAAIGLAPDKRTEVQKYLAAKLEPILKVTPEEAMAALDAKDRTAAAVIEKQIADITGRRRSYGQLEAVCDVGPPTPTLLLKRGNHLTPGDEVAPGFISVLTAPGKVNDLGPVSAAGKTSGRRLALARWLTDSKSPAGALVMRVRVNRVWQQLFGRGIVETADNFGVTGSKPTHPELLEWLAGEYASNGQKLKPLLKLLMTSTAYRQASTRTDAAAAVDPDNALLWRQRLRRLESEALRDSILTASGALDRTIGGPAIPVEPRPDGTFVVPEKNLPTPMSPFRRSVYLLARRNYHPTLLGAFDQPNLATNCTRRPASAVVLQPLTMLNDRFLLEQVNCMAERVAKTAPSPEARVAAAFGFTLTRAPRSEEVKPCLELLARHADRYRAEKLPAEAADRQALAHLCLVLLNTSEFLYIP
jgi:hypothetical protein